MHLLVEAFQHSIFKILYIPTFLTYYIHCLVCKAVEENVAILALALQYLALALEPMALLTLVHGR